MLVEAFVLPHPGKAGTPESGARESKLCSVPGPAPAVGITIISL